MTLVVKSDKCRLCGRVLKDQSDLWAGRCNNDDACAKRVYARDEADVEKIVIERDSLRETVRSIKARVVDLEQRLIDAECERDASRGMEQAAEQRAERLYRDRERVTAANDAMREPMRRLREAANMPAQGESAVVGEVLARLADRSRRLDQIAAAAALVQTTVQRYFDQHGPSCDEHSDEPDHTCPTCCIDIDASDAISGLKFWSKP
jgi:hypothetical protein